MKNKFLNILLFVLDVLKIFNVVFIKYWVVTTLPIILFLMYHLNGWIK